MIAVIHDSLNKHFLTPYGCEWVYTYNFKRRVEKTVVFDNCYAGRLLCTPARKELHLERYNFLNEVDGSLNLFMIQNHNNINI